MSDYYGNSFSGLKEIEYLAKKIKYKKHIVSQFFTYEETFSYHKNKIPIGIDFSNEPVYIDVSEAARILIIGTPGAGKSFIMRGFWNRFYLSDGLVAIPTDIKPEAWSSVNPIQEKYYKFLLPKEKPQGFHVKTYYPYFFTNFVSKRFEHELCQLSLDSLNVYDFITLLGIQISDSQRILLESVFKKIKEYQITNLEELKKTIEKTKEIASQTKKVILNSINILESYGVIGDQFSDFSFTEDLKEKFVPSLNLYGFNKLGRYVNYPAAYVAVILREIYASKTEGQIPKKKRLLLCLDELARFCPNTGEPSSKREILEILELGRQSRISMIFAVQDVVRVPDTIMKECDYILLPYNVDLELAKEVVRRSAPQEYTYPTTFGVELANRLALLRKHKDGSRDWLLINKHSKTMDEIKPLAPLSCIVEEGEL